MNLDHDKAWHEERRKGIGGSDAGRIMNGEWRDLWLEKTGRKEPDDLSNVLQVQLGSFTEPFNLAWAERQAGYTITTEGCAGLVSAKYPFMRANLDGIIAQPHSAIFEAKHVNAFSKPEDIISRYYWQLLHCMAVAEIDTAVLSIIFGNHKWEAYDVEADDESTELLIAREREFWWHVENDTAPDDRQDVGEPAISFDEMRECDLSHSNAWVSAATDWLENKDAAKKFEDAKTALKDCVEPDVKLAYGAGIKATRSKNGSITLKEYNK